MHALAAQHAVGERERALDLRDARAETAVRELAVDDVEARRQAIRGAIAQRHREVEAHGARAGWRFEPREILAEVARDQRRAVQEREHLIEPADRIGLQREVAGAQIADADAHVGRAVAEHAAAAARREPRVDELDGAVEVLGERPVADERELAVLDVDASRGTRLRRRRTGTRARARRT